MCVFATVRRVLCPLPSLSGVDFSRRFLVSSNLRFLLSNTRTVAALSLCSSRTSLRLSDDFPNDFPTTKGARVLACVLWCWCWCWCSARNEELMKIRARERRDAFESNGTLVVQKKIRRDSNGKERRRRRILVHDFLASWSGARPIASLVLFFVFFFRSKFFRLRGLSRIQSVFTRMKDGRSPQKKGMDV